MRCSSRSARRRAAATATPICPTSTPRRARSPRALDGFTVVVTKSTVPVGTGDEVERIIREARPDADFAVVSNPEFLREGAAIQDFKHPDRIVVGTEDERAHEVMARALPAAVSQPAADPVHRPPHRRADQIRRQRVPRDQDHLHQRDRRSLRAGRRRRAGGRARHRPRQPHRLQVPARRPGLWRLVLSQGHAGADQDRAGLRRAAAHRRDGGRGQRHAQARDGAQGRRRARRRRSRGKTDRGARPDLQAEHRRHARCAVDPADHGAAGHGRDRCAPTIPRAWSRRRRC